MALTAFGFTLSVTLRDSGFNQTTKEYQLRATTHADAVTQSADIIVALHAVSDARVQNYRITQRYADTAFSGGGGEVEVLAIVSGISSSARGVSLEIPAPIDGLFKNTTGTDKNVVDMADPALITYIDMFKSGGEAYISDGESWVTSIEGQRGTKKSRQKSS